MMQSQANSWLYVTAVEKLTLLLNALFHVIIVGQFFNDLSYHSVYVVMAWLTHNENETHHGTLLTIYIYLSRNK